MIIKIKDKEYSFDGYVNPINSVQKLAEDIYEQGRADAIDEFARTYEQVELIGCDDCRHSNDDVHCWECVAEQLKEQNNDSI